MGRKIGLQKMRRAVVLVVVDAADFDGSLPRAALEGLFSNIEGYQVLCLHPPVRVSGTPQVLLRVRQLQ